MKRTLFTLMVMAVLACPVMGARYRQFQVVIVDEFGDAVTNIDTVEIQDAGTSTTSTIYSTRAGTARTNPMTTSSGGFDQSLGLVTWFQAAASFKVTITESGASQSMTVDNLTSKDTRFAWFVNYIGVAASLTVGDDNLLNIGTSADFTHDWDNGNTKYIIRSAADEGRLDFGIAAVHTDIYWHTGAAISSDYVLFDEGSANVQFIDIDILLDDEAVLFLGDSSDMSISYHATNNDLDVLSTTALDLINWGATGDGYDQKWWSTTSGDYMLFDYSEDALILEDMTLAIGDAESLLFGDTVGTGTMSLSVATAKLSLLQVVADTGTFDIGAAGTDVPTTWHGETSGAEVTFTGDTVIVDGIDMTFNDTDILGFGDSAAEGTIASDATGLNVTLGTSKALNFLRATAGTVNFGADNIGLDVVFFGEAADQKVWWDQSGDEWFFGADAEGVDVTFYGDTASSFMLWDENANTNGALIFDAADIEMGDGDFVQFGDGADLTISATTTTTTMLMAAGSVLTIADTDDSASLLTFGTNTGHGLDVLFQGATAAKIVDWDAGADTWNYGVDATGVDVYFYGDTTLHWMLWDETNNVLSFDGGNSMLEFRGATVDAHETTLATIEPTATNVLTLADDTGALSYIPTGSTTKDASDAALPLTHAVVLGTSGGASAWSLPDGNPGQVLTVIIDTDGGVATITPVSTTGDGWATMIFTNDGEGASFMFIDSTVGWAVLGTFGISTNPLITGE